MIAYVGYDSYEIGGEWQSHAWARATADMQEDVIAEEHLSVEEEHDIGAIQSVLESLLSLGYMEAIDLNESPGLREPHDIAGWLEICQQVSQ